MSDDRYQKLIKVVLGVGLDFAAYGIDEHLINKEQLASDWNALLRARTKQVLELEAVRREKKRLRKRGERQKAKENNHRGVATVATTEQRWRNSLLSLAGDIRSEWDAAFGDWTKFKASQDLIDAANQAVSDWTEIAAILKGNLS